LNHSIPSGEYDRQHGSKVGSERKLAFRAHIWPLLCALASSWVAANFLSFRLLGVGMLFLLMLPAGALLLALWIFCPLIAAKAANNGGEYRYPMTLHLLK